MIEASEEARDGLDGGLGALWEQRVAPDCYSSATELGFSTLDALSDTQSDGSRNASVCRALLGAVLFPVLNCLSCTESENAAAGFLAILCSVQRIDAEKRPQKATNW